MVYIMFILEEEIMLDIKFLRENPDVVKQNIKNKFQDKKLPLVDEVIKLDEETTIFSSRCHDACPKGRHGDGHFRFDLVS